MKEEITIKLAECKERGPTTADSVKTSSYMKEITTITEGKSIPVALAQGINRKSKPFAIAAKTSDDSSCTRYLKCRKDIWEMKIQCNVLIGLPTSGAYYNWGISYNHIPEPLDEKDRDCKNKYSKQIKSLQDKRTMAEQHLEECVRLVNITKEPIVKRSVCHKLVKTQNLSISKLKKERCLKDITKKKKQCLNLRKCCLQADICERSAMYGMLSDDYLFALTETTTAINNCYHRHYI
uniref:ShKT domain-containing protein n=1 Tax=Heterorhabditis bacteriophora TaxID=37862 RepID=A0A1I7XUE5_HETBA